MTHDELVEKAVLRDPPDTYTEWSDRIIAVVLEEAAKETRPPAHMLGSADPYANGYRAACAEINARIRALTKND